MRSRRPALVGALLALACGGTPAPGGPGAPGGGAGVEPPAFAGMVAAHDAERDLVGVPHLAWDAALAAVAQAWVSRCVSSDGRIVGHDPDRTAALGTGEYVGENVYASTAGSAAPQAVVAAWASEKQWYDHATNTCAAGHVCGHYTQVVWRTTARVGCGIADCPTLAYRTNVVCDYAPGGNVGRQAPY